MTEVISWLRMTELDRIGLPDFAERIALAEEEGFTGEPRRYPGYPTWPLPAIRRRWWPLFDTVLQTRRCHRQIDTTFPAPHTLARLLKASHGVTDEWFRGPTPSAGGLQAVELYLVHWQEAWLPKGVYHYDRRGHQLAQLLPTAEQDFWRENIPSLSQVAEGAIVWLIIGDGRRVAAKYGERGERFLLLEAGHLMQNLCLVSTSLCLTTVPLGGCFERPVARELRLPTGDHVLYAGVCGPVASVSHQKSRSG